MAAEFEIEGTKFRVQRLGVDEVFAGLELVMSVAGPAFEQWVRPAAQRDLGQIAKALSGGLGKIPKLIALFEGVAETTLPGTRNWAKLELVKQQTFEGRHDVAILFCAHCILAEYGDFLASGLARVVEQCGILFQSLAEQTPGSGG